MADQKSQIEIINTEINRELSSPEVAKALLATTFKGLTPVTMKQAIMEGMIRGFTFKDFLEKNVYAIPFKEGYSLITSIDFARKKGMKSNVVGKTAPEYEEGADGIISCTVTVKRLVSGHIGDFTAKVYFSEYYKAGKNGYPSLWDTKPRTMIAKVAEMHALRMACPEELSQTYIEEELEPTPVVSRMGESSTLVEETELKMGKFKKNEKGEEGEDKNKVSEANSQNGLPH